MEKKRKQVTLFFLLNHPYTRRVEDVQLSVFLGGYFGKNCVNFFFISLAFHPIWVKGFYKPKGNLEI
jgi:hypothetical protein